MIPALLLAFILPFPLRAEELDTVRLPVTPLDLPYNLHDGARYPSLRQSLEAEWDIDRLAILGIHQGFSTLFRANGPPGTAGASRAAPSWEGLRMGLGLTSAGLATLLLIPVSVWTHEEWHQAVLGQYGIQSVNQGWNPLAVLGGSVSVTGVPDEALARLKAEHPADTVRLMTAGFESHQIFVAHAEDEAFFHGIDSNGGLLFRADTWMAPMLVANEIANASYFAICASAAGDRMTDDWNREEPTVRQRDFTGLDCTAWIYDMDRPREPYADRGPHPFGQGVDRYISLEDLTPSEQRALLLQTRLYLLNVLDPHLFGINGVELGNGRRVVASVREMITPWGWEIDGRFGLHQPGLSARLELRNGLSAEGWFPGLAVSLLDERIPNAKLSVDLGLEGWLQPAGQLHDSARRVPGGRVTLDLGRPFSRHWDITAGVEGKSEGFVPGVLYLGPQLGAHLGITAHL
jgi:hypothetical protein